MNSTSYSTNLQEIIQITNITESLIDRLEYNEIFISIIYLLLIISFTLICINVCIQNTKNKKNNKSDIITDNNAIKKTKLVTKTVNIDRPCQWVNTLINEINTSTLDSKKVNIIASKFMLVLMNSSRNDKFTADQHSTLISVSIGMLLNKKAIKSKYWQNQFIDFINNDNIDVPEFLHTEPKL